MSGGLPGVRSLSTGAAGALDASSCSTPSMDGAGCSLTERRAHGRCVSPRLGPRRRWAVPHMARSSHEMGQLSFFAVLWAVPCTAARRGRSEAPFLYFQPERVYPRLGASWGRPMNHWPRRVGTPDPAPSGAGPGPSPHPRPAQETREPACSPRLQQGPPSWVPLSGVQRAASKGPGGWSQLVCAWTSLVPPLPLLPRAARGSEPP